RQAAPTPVAAPPHAAAPVAAPAPAPAPVRAAAAPVVAESNVPWPVQLKVTAIFYSLNHPRIIMNGNVYAVGEEYQGILVKKIEKNKVTVEWNGHKKQLMLDSQYPASARPKSQSFLWKTNAKRWMTARK